MLSAPAAAQEPSHDEMRAINAIASCLLTGLPQEWKRVEMIVELTEPLAGIGDVQYLVTGADDRRAPFSPCDEKLPVRALLEVREAQPPAQRGWRTARLVLEPSGEFRLNYDYPK
jgi:hypothetical protein